MGKFKGKLVGEFISDFRVSFGTVLEQASR